MKVYENYSDLIGNTPIIKLSKIDFPVGINLYAKLELWNPGGSVKDRVGQSIIKDAEDSGKLKKGGTIIEATAGNTGIGIAFAAIGKGYNVKFVVPEKYSQEKQDIMRILGAEVINTPRDKGMTGGLEKIQELLKENPDYVYVDQYKNKANPKAHYETTGPEIYRDLDGKVDYFIAGAGSGGTISGVGKYLKEQDKNIKIVLADPVNSIVGGPATNPTYHSVIEGVGSSFVPGIYDASVVDEVIRVNDEEGLPEIKLLAKREGILAGGSSGLILAAARKLAEKVKTGNIVVVLTDRGDRYLSKGIFN
ncbi:MAG: cysteine synthase A [Rickettsiales bacterium]|nr:MAG: cysteine synthase A [Rickettsiales bacterium]